MPYTHPVIKDSMRCAEDLLAKELNGYYNTNVGLCPSDIILTFTGGNIKR